ncbi:MAG: hypothetical protein C0456_16475 [Hyphomonas sp.]|nr:hypothetical protein [Hyphomonas sp.]
MVSALSIARERELGTFEQLLVSPLQPIEILIGKAAPALIIALASATAMLILGWLVLDVPLFPVSDCETDRRNCLRRISGSS